MFSTSVEHIFCRLVRTRRTALRSSVNICGEIAEMSSTSVDDESCVSGTSKDDGDFCDETRSPPVDHFPSINRFPSQPPRNGARRHRETDMNAAPSAKTTTQHHHHHQQQHPTHQAPLSPRSREYLRLRVNARERQRMHDMNVALDALRRAMPYAQGPAVKKLSKMNTLLLARNYILLLTRTLDELRRLLVAPSTGHHQQAALSSTVGSASEFAGCRTGAGASAGVGTKSGHVMSRPMNPIEHQIRLEAALRGLIDGREINAEQQRYAEELVRREQLQMRQEQEQTDLMTSSSMLTKSGKKNDGSAQRGRRPRDSNGGRKAEQLDIPSIPEVQVSNRKRKMDRSQSPDSPSPRSVFADEKDVVASSTDDVPKHVDSHVTKYPDARLLQFAVPPPSTSGPLMMMTSSRLSEMTAVGFTPAAAHQAMSSSSSAAAAAAAMMGHMISGPYPSCPCPHCADSRPTYIMPIDLVTAAAAAAHYQQHRL